LSFEKRKSLEDGVLKDEKAFSVVARRETSVSVIEIPCSSRLENWKSKISSPIKP
jgi:hypothetical protein